MSKIEFVNFQEEELLIRRLNKQNVRVIRLDGSKVIDKDSFFKQAAVDIPSNPQGWYARNWDGFNDNFSAELRGEEWKKAVFIWSNVENVLENGLEVLVELIIAIDKLSFHIKSKPDHYSPLVDLKLVLTGTGHSFSISSAKSVG